MPYASSGTASLGSPTMPQMAWSSPAIANSRCYPAAACVFFSYWIALKLAKQSGKCRPHSAKGTNCRIVKGCKGWWKKKHVIFRAMHVGPPMWTWCFPLENLAPEEVSSRSLPRTLVECQGQVHVECKVQRVFAESSPRYAIVRCRLWNKLVKAIELRNAFWVENRVYCSWMQGCCNSLPALELSNCQGHWLHLCMNAYMHISTTYSSSLPEAHVPWTFSFVESKLRFWIIPREETAGSSLSNHAGRLRRCSSSGEISTAHFCQGSFGLGQFGIGFGLPNVESNLSNTLTCTNCWI